jgi:hypothetical protein
MHQCRCEAKRALDLSKIVKYSFIETYIIKRKTIESSTNGHDDDDDDPGQFCQSQA